MLYEYLIQVILQLLHYTVFNCILNVYCWILNVLMKKLVNRMTVMFTLRQEACIRNT